jgi:hypothetical protein
MTPICFFVFLFLVSKIDALPRLLEPFPTLVPDTQPFEALIDSISAFPNDLNPLTRVEKSKSLRDFIRQHSDLVKFSDAKATIECGNSNAHGTPQPLTSRVLMKNATSQGPCEAWCDDTRVFQSDNCAQFQGNFTLEVHSCHGKSTFQMLYLDTHLSTWRYSGKTTLI